MGPHTPFEGFEYDPVPTLQETLLVDDASGFDHVFAPTLKETLSKQDLSGFKHKVSLKSLFGG